jgi:uncharacterized phage protein gp47/JayE
VTQVLGVVIGGAIYLLYLFLREIGKQMFINSADEEGLSALGNEYGVPRKDATPAGGDVIPIPIVGGGATIPTGIQLQNTAGGLYTTKAEVIVPEPNIRSITFNGATNEIQEASTPRQNDDQIVFLEGDGLLPAELSTNDLYYVVNAVADTFQVASIQGGAAIVFTGDGTPPNYYATAVEIDIVQDQILENNTPRLDGDKIVFTSYGGNLPTGITADTIYYVRDQLVDSFKIALTESGNPVDIRDAGTGVISYDVVTFVEISAVEKGLSGNIPAGESVYLLSPISGIEQYMTVSPGSIYGGADEESLDDWRERLSLRKKNPPSGGSRYDYLRWALEVPGVTRAWVCGAELAGPGTVSVTFVKDDSDPIVPTQTELDAMRAYLISHTDPATGLNVGIPITDIAGLSIPSLTSVRVKMTILLPVETQTTTIKAEILDAIKEYVRRDGGPGQTLYASRLSDAISSVPGETRHIVTGVLFDDDPISDFINNGIPFAKTEVGIVEDSDIGFGNMP